MAEGQCGVVAKKKLKSAQFLHSILPLDVFCSQGMPQGRDHLRKGRTIWNSAIISLFVVAIAREGVRDPCEIGFDEPVIHRIVKALHGDQHRVEMS